MPEPAISTVPARTHRSGTSPKTIQPARIAIGSAVSVAADHRVDNRVMYSVGIAAVNIGLLGFDVRIAYGIPLAARGKNIFFDRK